MLCPTESGATVSQQELKGLQKKKAGTSEQRDIQYEE